MKLESHKANSHASEDDYKVMGEHITLEHPEIALALLESNQLDTAKQKIRFGPQKLTCSEEGLMWGLRIYVVIMLIIVLVSAFQALHAGH